MNLNEERKMRVGPITIAQETVLSRAASPELRPALQRQRVTEL